MATTSIGSTGVTFPDATVQASASPGEVVTTIYSSPATWTKNPALKAVRVTLVSGGGGGGSGRRPSNGPAGNGGGGGAYGVAFIPAPSVPSPQSVTVGSAGIGGVSPSPAAVPGTSGGTSSFGAFITATGGGGGPANGGGSTGGSITPSPSVIGIPGAPGGTSPSTPVTTATVGGAGGDGALTWGRGGAAGNPTGNGGVAVGYGGGGGGAGSGSGSGGNGTAGYVIVEEFY